MSEDQKSVVVHQSSALSMKQITDRVNIVHEVLQKVMKKGTHYGTVPGCGTKMVLLKPGADVLAMTFRLVPQFQVHRTELENGHREFDVTCSMYGPDGALLGQGVGSASTMEKKYRYRKDERGGKVENEDIADVYNTVLKIAKKRAHIDGTLTVTGAADLFTQDIIDDDEREDRPPVGMPKEKAAPPPANEEPPAHVEKPDLPTVFGLVEQAGKKPTKKEGCFRYGIKVGDAWYNTFDSAFFDAAEKAKADGKQVRIQYSEGKYGKDILTLGVVQVDENGELLHF
jgi:hypothetical protein